MGSLQAAGDPAHGIVRDEGFDRYCTGRPRPRDDQALHFAGSLADLQDLGVPVEPGHRELLHEPAAASTTAESLEKRAAKEPAPQTLSLCGAFHLVLAVTAARENDRPQANRHLDRAREMAAGTGQDRNDFGTEFGPANVALHAVSVAVELGDAGQALDLARDIQPERLSAERQARFLIDLAQAHAMRRQAGEALRCLEQANG